MSTSKLKGKDTRATRIDLLNILTMKLTEPISYSTI